MQGHDDSLQSRGVTCRHPLEPLARPFSVSERAACEKTVELVPEETHEGVRWCVSGV